MAGFSLLELTMTMAVGVILTLVAIPVVKSSVQYFRVRSAVSSVTGAIQSTRYRAIFDGCRTA
jgi:prepilin-type N-terminal cleavage/methylation domain-containing protein